MEVKAVDLQSNVPDNIRKMLDDCRKVAQQYAAEARMLEAEVRRLNYEAEILAIELYFKPEKSLGTVGREVMATWRPIINAKMDKHINGK